MFVLTNSILTKKLFILLFNLFIYINCILGTVALCQRSFLVLRLCVKPGLAAILKVRGTTTTSVLCAQNARATTHVRFVVYGLPPLGKWRSPARPFPSVKGRKAPFLVFLLLPPYQGGGVWLRCKETPVV